jgi:hypothetical protein
MAEISSILGAAGIGRAIGKAVVQHSEDLGAAAGWTTRAGGHGRRELVVSSETNVNRVVDNIVRVRIRSATGVDVRSRGESRRSSCKAH